MNRLVAGTFVVMTALAAAPAEAQISQSGELHIYDSTGKDIGVWLEWNYLRRIFGDGVARFVEFSANGLADYVVFNYTTTDCTGQRYLSIDSDGKHIPVVTQAYYEDQPSSGTPASNGKTIWGAAPNALMSITAFSYYYQQDSYVVVSGVPYAASATVDGRPADDCRSCDTSEHDSEGVLAAILPGHKAGSVRLDNNFGAVAGKATARSEPGRLV